MTATYNITPPPGQLIFGNIITIVATRGQILWLKYTKFYFGWGSGPDPDRGVYIYNAATDHLAGFKEPASRRERRKG